MCFACGENKLQTALAIPKMEMVLVEAAKLDSQAQNQMQGIVMVSLAER